MLIFLVSGCKLAEGLELMGRMPGSGQIVLSSQVKQDLKKYLASYGPEDFFVSIDGKVSKHSICLAHTCKGSGWDNQLRLSRDCERKASTSCKLFARKGTILWANFEYSEIVDILPPRDLCRRALNYIPHKSASWGVAKHTMEFVRESKQRGYSVKQCVSHANYDPVPTRALVEERPSSAPVSNTSLKPASSVKAGSVEDRLARLKQLVEEGLVTEMDAAAKRREILKGL